MSLSRSAVLVVIIEIFLFTVFRGCQARSLYSKLKRITVIQENIVKNFLETVSVGYKYNQLISAFQFSLIAQFIPKRSNCRIPCHYCSGLYLRTYFCAGINYLKWQGILQLSHIFHICLQLSSSFSRKQRKKTRNLCHLFREIGI